MFCNQCGEELAEGTKFCTRCGAKQTDELYSSEDARETLEQEKKATASKDGLNESFSSVPIKAGKKLWIWLGAAAVCCAAAGIGAFSVWNSRTSPQTVASRYFVSVVNNDAAQAFQCLNIKETDWLNPVTFEAQIRMADEKNPDYTTVRSYEAIPDSGSGKQKTYRMEYSYGEKGETGSALVDLVEENGQWGVAADPFLLKDVQLKFLKGSSVKINGIELNDDFLKAGESSTESVYVIPEMFSGVYEIEAELSGYEPYNGLQTLEKGSSIEITGNKMPVSRQTAEQLQKQAGEDLKKLYGALAQKAEYSQIQDLFSSESGIQQSVGSEYMAEVRGKWTSQPVVSLSMDSLETKGTTDSTTVSIAGNWKIFYLQNSVYSGASNAEASGEKTIEMHYVRDGESWKLAKMPDLNLPY